jgi:MoaA/NifB/PqqE/SkfB family radical SAM enzyme
MFRKLIDRMKRYNLRHVILTGGEPLLHPDLNLLIEYLILNDISVEIYTSGFSSISNLYKKIHSYDHSKITWTFNYITTNSYEFRVLYQLNEHYNNSLNNNIKFVREYNYKIGSNIILTKHNMDNIIKTLYDLKDKGITFINKQRLINYDNKYNKMLISDDHLKKLLNQIQTEFKDDENFTINYGTNNSHLIKTGIHKCDAMQTKLTIKSNGDVIPCLACIDEELIIGNIYSETFDEIFSNNKIELYLSQIKLKTNENEYCPAIINHSKKS